MFVQSLVERPGRLSKGKIVADVCLGETDEIVGFCVLWNTGCLQRALVSERIVGQTIRYRSRSGLDASDTEALKVLKMRRGEVAAA